MIAHGWLRKLQNENFIHNKTGDPFEDSFRFVLPGYSVRPLEMSGAIGQVQLSKENSAKIRSAIKELSAMSVDEDTFKAINQKIGGLELVHEIKAHANLPIRNGQALEQDAD